MFGRWQFVGGSVSEETSAPGEFSSEGTLWFQFFNSMDMILHRSLYTVNYTLQDFRNAAIFWDIKP
jgi:hypothetical protein